MDKNKSAYKLKGLPPIYYTNLDRSPERQKYMEDQFKYWEIEDYSTYYALKDVDSGEYLSFETNDEVTLVSSLGNWEKFTISATNDLYWITSK